MEPEIPCSELLVRLGDDDILVLDCRDGHTGSWMLDDVQIPGAIRMRPSELPNALAWLPDDELIVVCGDGKDGSDARRTWRMLLAANRRAVCLRGGLLAWIAGGYPTERCGEAQRSVS